MQKEIRVNVYFTKKGKRIIIDQESMQDEFDGKMTDLIDNVENVK